MYLSFQLDSGKRLAVDLRKIHRVEAHKDVFVVPRQKSAVMGLYLYENLLVPVFDFHKLLGSFLGTMIQLPHLVIFYGPETLNAFPALVEESIQEDLVMLDNSLNVPFLDAYDLIYNDSRYHQLDFRAIEEHLNIP